MVDFIESIYTYSQIIPAIKEIISDVYSDRTSLVKKKWPEVQPLISELTAIIEKDNPLLAANLFQAVKEACSHTFEESYRINLFADKLSETIPLFYDAIACLGSIDTSDDKTRFVSSRSGFLTIEKLASTQYIHSTIDPMWEAYTLANSIYDSKYTEYRILGCGLGYLPFQLFSITDSSADIYVYHTDESAINNAYDFGVLSWISPDKLHVIIDSDSASLLKSFTDNPNNEGHCMYYALPDILGILREKESVLMENFIGQVKTGLAFKNYKEISSCRNVMNITQTLDDFKKYVHSNEWIVVMAGPSLDESLEEIRMAAGHKMIICASTVLKKLLMAGIIPDCVSALDPQPRTYGHFEDLPCETVPLMCSSIANWRFGELYAGDKYLVPCSADTFSNDYFKSHKLSILDLGSTVAVMCIEIAAYLGATRIHLYGLDLSYPQGKSHASGTMDSEKVNLDDMLPVPCNGGGMVHTSKQFMIYINQINSLTAKHSDITFINHSKQGVRFENTKPDA